MKNGPAPYNNNNRRRPRNQPRQDTMQILSRKLSKVLRHQALALGFPITTSGYVSVPVLLHHEMFRRFSVDQIVQAVETSDKQRFKLEEIDGILHIRANQGHSMSFIRAEELLQEITSTELAAIPTIVHGTYFEPWKIIQREGLKTMKRNHIHFATAVPADGTAISGMRKSSQVHIFVDAEKCAQDGILFYRSDNGVILTAGKEGVLSPKYFRTVTDKSGRDIGFQRYRD